MVCTRVHAGTNNTTSSSSATCNIISIISIFSIWLAQCIRMTCSDLSTIVITVAVTQLICDLLARRFVFQKEPYERALARLGRMQFQQTKFQANNKHDTTSKKAQRIQSDLDEARAHVAKQHTVPQILTSVVFIVLYRILTTEHAGHVIGVLPFTPPFKWVLRLTMRGIDFGDADMVLPSSSSVTDPTQAAAFLFIYGLCTLSVKYYVHEAVAVKPPKGADGGFMTIMDDPKNQKLLKVWGLDKGSMEEYDKRTS